MRRRSINLDYYIEKSNISIFFNFRYIFCKSSYILEFSILFVPYQLIPSLRWQPRNPNLLRSIRVIELAVFYLKELQHDPISRFPKVNRQNLNCCRIWRISRTFEIKIKYLPLNLKRWSKWIIETIRISNVETHLFVRFRITTKLIF